MTSSAHVASRFISTMIGNSLSRFQTRSTYCTRFSTSVIRSPGSLSNPCPDASTSCRKSTGRVQCRRDENSDSSNQGNSFFTSWSDEVIVYGTALFLTSSSLILWYFLRDPIEDLIYGGDLTNLLGTSISLGDVTALALWTLAYYYISPLQILFIFLGRIDTDRPSDWILYKLGQALDKPVDDVDYEADGVLYGIMIGLVFLTALLTTAGISFLVNGATWSVSTGIGACMAAGLFEVGRPPRMSLKQKQKLDKQFEDFVEFADRRLQRTGSCHESEIFQRFRSAFREYEDEENLSDVDLRRFVKQWAPRSKKTGNGFFKKVSLRQESETS